jgi:hypothetical protein
MQPMKTYRAAQKIPYGKKRLAIGEAFEAPQNIGDMLVKVGKATHDTGSPTPVDLPAEVMSRASKREPLTEVEAQPAAPLYRTRHMEAEKLAEKPAPKKKPGRPGGKAKRSQS